MSETNDAVSIPQNAVFQALRSSLDKMISFFSDFSNLGSKTHDEFLDLIKEEIHDHEKVRGDDSQQRHGWTDIGNALIPS